MCVCVCIYPRKHFNYVAYWQLATRVCDNNKQRQTNSVHLTFYQKHSHSPSFGKVSFICHLSFQVHVPVATQLSMHVRVCVWVCASRVSFYASLSPDNCLLIRTLTKFPFQLSTRNWFPWDSIVAICGTHSNTHTFTLQREILKKCVLCPPPHHRRTTIWCF